MPQKQTHIRYFNHKKTETAAKRKNPAAAGAATGQMQKNNRSIGISA